MFIAFIKRFGSLRVYSDSRVSRFIIPFSYIMTRNHHADPLHRLPISTSDARITQQVANMLLSDYISGDVQTIGDVNTIVKTNHGPSFGFIDLSDGIQLLIDCICNWLVLVSISRNENMVVLVNIGEKRMHCYIGSLGRYALEEVQTDGTNGTIDLDAAGRRWEGGVRNGIPHGYGVLYNEDGGVEYEGFMVDSQRFCYGKEYYADIGQVKYDGNFYDDKRIGMGTLYGRNGHVDYEGLWRDDKPFDPESIGTVVDESFIVSAQTDTNVKTCLIPCWLYSLKRIEIGNSFFGRVRSLNLVGLNSLESVVIGTCCFTYAKTNNKVFYSVREDGTCRIAHCPKLASIQFGDFSFSDYRLPTLESLPSLQSIQLGENCFYHAPLFSLTGWSDRKTRPRRSSSASIRLSQKQSLQELSFCRV